MLADGLDYVIGVDTHRDEHVLAVLTAAAGAVVAGEALPANARGYRCGTCPRRAACWSAFTKGNPALSPT